VTSVVTTIRRGVNSSRAVKVPCIAATTANITLSGEQTIDGVACVAGNRVLVKDQTDASENGIYAVDTSAWGREPDWDGTYDVVKGTYVYVSGGAVGNNFWQVTTADPITIGTTDVALQATDPDSLLRTNLADTSTGQGASLVGVEDSAGNFSGATVEAVLAEIIADYAATTNGNGASKIGIEDVASDYTATNVEAALAEVKAAADLSTTGLATITTRDAAATTGYDRGIYLNLKDDCSYDTATLTTAISANTWTTIGPTGSGATYIWTALDSIPVGATQLLLKVVLSANHSVGVPKYLLVSARESGGSAVAAAQIAVLTGNGAAYSFGGVGQGYVPLNGSNIFEGFWNSDTWDTTQTAILYLVGWVE
jgi:hypothetical protein